MCYSWQLDNIACLRYAPPNFKHRGRTLASSECCRCVIEKNFEPPICALTASSVADASFYNISHCLFDLADFKRRSCAFTNFVRGQSVLAILFSTSICAIKARSFEHAKNCARSFGVQESFQAVAARLEICTLELRARKTSLL